MISALLTSRIVIQFLGQIVALIQLRVQRPEMPRPFRMWLYPVPAVVAFAGGTYIFMTSGKYFIAFGVLTLVVGAIGLSHPGCFEFIRGKGERAAGHFGTPGLHSSEKGRRHPPRGAASH